MKRFLRNGFHFLGYLLVLNLLFYLAIKKLYYDPYPEYDTSFDTFLLSDSHGDQLGIETEKIGLYNFSAPSDSYADMLRKVEFALRQGKPKRILLAVDDHMLSTYREEYNNLDRSIMFTQATAFDSKWEWFNQRYTQRYLPLLNSKNRDVLLANIKGTLSSATGFSKPWAELSPAQRAEKAKARTSLHYTNVVTSDTLYRKLRSLLEICERQNVEVIGVRFPVTRTYLDHQEHRGFKSDTVLSNRGIRIWDFKDVYLDEDGLFRDQDHLNQQGVQKFIDLLGTKL